MTLRELIDFLNLIIPNIPEELEDFEIRNEADFCRYPLINYFLSVGFQQDMHNAEIYWKNNSYEGVNFYFLFHRDKERLFSIELVSEFS